ncbi:MAG: MaoC family dehydratase [Desulfobacterales bacterium]|nr:MaoC family dehydratase [Desulfobacterales bacterium]
MDEEYSRKTYFGTRIAHGLLSAGFISTVLGTQLPGPGTIYLRQELTFLGAVKIGDTITARVEVVEIDTAKGRAKLLTTCDNQEGVRVLTGEAVVSPPRPTKPPA